MGLSGAELEKQMSWVQEPEFLNTYSFKQRPETSPRIHVLSVQMALNEELTVAQEGEEPSDVGGETGSIITALPAVPPPTPASIPSVSCICRIFLIWIVRLIFHRWLLNIDLGQSIARVRDRS